ncbi:hypothetical protein A0256_11580 [Mucilaginibacter sp. PAMC 26640]|nr:hypothetical protein A0256_11580 [Mucilaginibacter sp. PAMC 26640]
MKKPALLVLGLMLIGIISTYFIVPQFIVAKSTVNVDVTDVNVSRFLMIKQAWPKWWPGQHNPADGDLFTYDGKSYTITKDANSYVALTTNTGKIELAGKLSYFALDDGSTAVEWTAQKQSSLNPIERVLEFIRIKQEQKRMDTILTAFKQFVVKDQNLYGINVKVAKVKDGIMLATNTVSKSAPSMAVIEALVTGLRKQIAAQNAKETNKPMLNINQADDKGYQVMVAIPVNKEIAPGQGNVINRMNVGGNILETEVKGGRHTIDNAFTQLKNYQKDHSLISPAMPFELMVTDRSIEKDTAKWVTKVYWPIF